MANIKLRLGCGHTAALPYKTYRDTYRQWRAGVPGMGVWVKTGYGAGCRLTTSSF